MCLLCSEAAYGGRGIAIMERPAHRLHGLAWEGTDEAAAGGAVRAVIAEVKAWSDGRASLWKSPIAMLSWNDRPGGFRCFVGIAPEEGEALPEGFSAIDLPEMRFVAAWHGPDDGLVVSRYGAMIDWLRGSGYRRDATQFHQREEYPHDADLGRPHTLRLMLPVVSEAGETR